jgi:lipoprotein-anchoring transpeptidase ErfK/SrfK
VSRFSKYALLFSVALGACRTAEVPATPAVDSSPEAIEMVDAGPPVDARAVKITALRDALEAGTYEGSYIGAASLHTTVLDRMEWPPDLDAGPSPEAGVRLGYVRYGGKVAALTEPFSNAACLEGWYELVEGGYVCGKYATFDLRDPRVRLAPQPPNLGASMPYKYGYATGNGTPVYRRVLSMEDRKKYEPWLAPPPPAPPEKDEGDETDSAGLLDPPAPKPAVDAGSVPWFMREHDGGRPPVTLDDLHGRGVLVRRMMRGFYLALDRDFKAAHARWWRTTAGFAVPFERVGLQGPPSEFHGSWIKYDVTEIDGGAPLEPNGAAILVTSGASVKYAIDAEKKKLTWSAPLPKMTAVALSGEPVAIGGAQYHQTTYGYWVRLGDGMLVAPQEQADGGATGEKWIDVDTTRQLLVAYEGTRPVFMTLISSGKKNPVDPEKNWTTPSGVYAIREKHVTATMDGDVAADGPYSIEDVPWVMYFQGSYALHAAFWHSAFGHPRSHGCVNMSPNDAHELFFWTEPQLPRGWHGVFATDTHPGTRVVVHESGDKKK